MTNTSGGFPAMGKEIMAAGIGQRIKCPLHYALIPGRLPFKTMPHPLFKNLDQGDLARVRVPIRDHITKQIIHPGRAVRTWIFQRDANGNKVPDRTSYFQPFISAAFAKEAIYRPNHPVCSACRRCQIK